MDPPLIWPPAPDTPRVGYIGAIDTSDDLKPARSIGTAFGEMLFGEPDIWSMTTPQALCTDHRNRLFICDSAAQIVHVFDLEKRTYERWLPDPGKASFAQPVGIAIDGRGRVLVSDSVGGTIHVFDARGGYDGQIGTDHLQRPCGLAIDLYGDRIFVADPVAHQVVVLDLEGSLLARLGTRGGGPGEYNFPTNVALDSEGRLFVSDTLNFRVQILDADGRPVTTIGGQGDVPGSFSRPKGLAFDSADHLYVVDAAFEAVQIFDRDGTLLLSFGEEGTGPGQFWLPSAIHIDANDRIWIADTYNCRVQVFDYLPEDP
jgi:sugar lactone lactonase YvrE